jgi:hypothetical protein
MGRPQPAFQFISIAMQTRAKRARSVCTLEHDPEKHALGLDPMGGNRFSEKIMIPNDI